MKASHYFLLIFLGLISACQYKLSPTEYIDWAEENLTKQRLVNSYVFNVMQRTSNYETLLRTGHQVVDQVTFTKEKAKLEGLEYYEVNISLEDQSIDITSKGTSTLEEKQSNIYYFSYSFQQDIHLMKGDQKIPCTLFHFKRSSQVSNIRSFMLGFAIPEHLKEEISTLVIQGQPLNTGPVTFKFPTINQPELALK